MNNRNLFAAATLGLFMGACSTPQTPSSDQPNSATPKVVTGECWGVNSCKGKGDCGGKGHSCAGKNACKGKGWKKMTKSDCTAKKGKFKA